jgi:hypothetical protein
LDTYKTIATTGLSAKYWIISETTCEAYHDLYERCRTSIRRVGDLTFA